MVVEVAKPIILALTKSSTPPDIYKIGCCGSAFNFLDRTYQRGFLYNLKNNPVIPYLHPILASTHL
ncbi:hypothetical protein FORC065_3693 [Yersinia enterocolitica]|nr:hypothetical protein FORC065_3693 [Yersinia enterocolitica]